MICVNFDSFWFYVSFWAPGPERSHSQWQITKTPPTLRPHPLVPFFQLAFCRFVQRVLCVFLRPKRSLLQSCCPTLRSHIHLSTAAGCYQTHCQDLSLWFDNFEVVWFDSSLHQLFAAASPSKIWNYSSFPRRMRNLYLKSSINSLWASSPLHHHFPVDAVQKFLTANQVCLTAPTGLGVRFFVFLFFLSNCSFYATTLHRKRLYNCSRINAKYYHKTEGEKKQEQESSYSS